MFFDQTSEELFDEIQKTRFVKSRVLLNIERSEIGQSYLTAKVLNRYGDNVRINIQGGSPGIELQESLFKIKELSKEGRPHYAFLTTKVNDVKNNSKNDKILVRKLPVVGMRDWLLIYEDTLVELAVKDAYDELEIIVV